MNMIKIWQKGNIIALLPADEYLEIMLSNGKILHVGPDGAYYKEAISITDEIEVTYHETED